MSAKKLKVSRNRKKTWKKHCSAADVEEFLEEKRFNERIGGSIAEKTDESLFFIEKTGDDVVIDNKSNEDLTKIESKLKKISSDLKCFKILEPQSKVSAIAPRVGPKNTKRTFLNDDQKFAKLWPQKRKQYLKAKEESEFKKRVQSDPNIRFQTYDIWDDKPNDEPVDSEVEELKDFQMILKGSKPPKVPLYRHQKPSLLPAIEPPHSGQSYNPALEDHQHLLAVAHDIEIDKMKKEKRLKRIVDGYYVNKTLAPNDKTWAEEMSHGLGLSDKEEEEEEEKEAVNEEDNADDVTSGKIIRADKKKTKAQRRRELLQKQLEAKKKLEKDRKAKDNEVFRIKSFKKELERREKESNERQKRRSQRIIDKLYKPRQMSRYKYEEPEVELKLSSELTGSLRTLKAEGNLLEDRYKSLQRRNLVESRVRQTFKRKYKLKKFTKGTCKDPIE